MAEETQTAVAPATDTNGTPVDPKGKKRRPGQSYFSLVRHQFRKNKLAVASLCFILFMFGVAIFADFLANSRPIIGSYKGTLYVPPIQKYLVDWGWATYPPEIISADWKMPSYDWTVSAPIPYDPGSSDLANSFAEPFSTSKHYLGADQLGRDVLAGIIHGSRVSLSIGFLSMGIAAAIGVLLGALAGYFGGWVDIAISRVIELFLNFPAFFLIITVVSFFDANIWLVMIVIGITGWMGIARFVRGEVLRVRNMEYVAAANSLGFGAMRVIFLHVLPNSLAPVLVSIAFGIAGAILTESALSFLGFGVPATMVTWGSMLNLARSNVYAWWLAIFPGLMIFLSVVSYNLIGDGLRDALDPRLRD